MRLEKLLGHPRMTRHTLKYVHAIKPFISELSEMYNYSMWQVNATIAKICNVQKL